MQILLKIRNINTIKGLSDLFLGLWLALQHRLHQFVKAGRPLTALAVLGLLLDGLNFIQEQLVLRGLAVHLEVERDVLLPKHKDPTLVDGLAPV